MLEEIDKEVKIPYQNHIENLGDTLLKVVKYKNE